MNKEEAIRVLEDNRPSVIFEDEASQKRMAELCQAIDMAIEALTADAVQGEWILVKGSNGKDYHKCSKCFHTQEITGAKNYCAVCGADMRGE